MGLRKKSGVIWLVGLALALTAFAACSSGDDDAVGDDQTEQTPIEQEVSQVAEEVADVSDSEETESSDADAGETGVTEPVEMAGVSGPSDGPPDEPFAFLSDPDLSEADIEYLVAVNNANASRDMIFERFGEIFESAWPLRSQLISALIEGGVGTPFVETLATLRALEPTDRFIDGHAILVEMVEAQVAVDAGARDSIIADDVAGFALANGELGRIAPTFGPLLPRHLCEATAGNAESTARMCAPLDDLPGGEYGAGLDALLRHNQAEVAAVGGAIFGFPLSLSDDELAQIFSQVFPVVTAVLAQQASDLAALNPPAEYASDNVVMETFFSDLSAFFDELAESAEAGDIDAVRFGLFDIEAIVCDALDGLGSGDVLEIVVVHLGPQAECGDSPFSEPVDAN